MILSESEKNRIKSLYGLQNEEETAPPDESVLIAIKNPFKYDEYKDARTFYNSSLKNGDRFYQIRGEEVEPYLNRNMLDDLTNYYKTNIFEKLQEQIDGKTVRIPQKDIISTITVQYPISNYRGNVEDNWYYTRINNTTGNRDLIGFDITLKLSSEGYIVVEYRRYRDIYFLSVVKGMDYNLSNTIKDHVTKSINTVINGMEPFKISNFDDNNFEIREIQRKQTDF